MTTPYSLLTCGLGDKNCKLVDRLDCFESANIKSPNPGKTKGNQVMFHLDRIQGYICYKVATYECKKTFYHHHPKNSQLSV